jgi:RNA polymerase sigma factor (sigma-70 family)
VEVVRDSYPPLRAAARRLAKSSSEGEDLVQEAFVETLSRYPDFDGLERPLGYLMTVLYRSAFRRSRLRQGELPLELEERLQAIEPDPDAPAMIDAALAGLGPKQRACLILRYLYGMDERDIAAVLDCRPSTVRSQIARGLANARERIGVDLDD